MTNFNPTFLFVGEIWTVGYIKGWRGCSPGRTRIVPWLPHGPAHPPATKSPHVQGTGAVQQLRPAPLCKLSRLPSRSPYLL